MARLPYSGTMGDYDDLITAFQKMHGATAVHVGSEPVTVRVLGDVLWTGVVESFALTGHPSATAGYGWTYSDDDGKDRHVVILSVPQVDTPTKAVQAYLVQSTRRAREKR